MKVTKVKTAEERAAEIKGATVQEYCIYLFRSPVIFNISGVEKEYSGNTAIIYESGKSRRFHGVGGKKLKYDLVKFKAASADRQYIAGLSIPLNTPVEVDDIYVMASAVKNLSIHLQSSVKRKTELGELYLRILLIALEDAAADDSGIEKDIPRYPQLKEIRQELYDDPFADWSVDRLCRRLAVSRTYFHRIYFSAFGISFRQDAIKSRLAYACELLLETELAVSVVAEKCGYENESYFMRQFKQHMGCTPTEYRRRTI